MKKLVAAFLVFLIIGVSINIPLSLAQSTQTDADVNLFDRRFDSDGDRICDRPKGHSSYNGLTGISQLGCNDTSYGDLCLGTEQGKSIGSGKLNSGCSPEQLARKYDFWSVSRDGELQPAILKVNWVTDSPVVKVYQRIKIDLNSRFGDEKIRLTDISASCDSGTGIISRSGEQNRRVQGSFLTAAMIPPQDVKDTKRLIEFKIFRREERGGSTDFVKKDLTSLPSDRISGIDEIETTCNVRISQCLEDENGGCTPLYPVEVDQITINIPIDTVAVQPPEFALDAGIRTSEEIIKLTDDLSRKFEKAFSFTFRWCAYSAGAVLATRFLQPIVEHFTGKFFSLADFIWYGPEAARNIAFTSHGGSPSNSFVISGRSMCAMAICPKDWCRAAKFQVGTEEVQSYLDLNKNGRADPNEFEWERDEKGDYKYFEGPQGGKTDTRIPKLINKPITLGSGATRVQDSLLLSVGCGCISGILGKLYQIRAIAEEWNFCLKDARAGKRFTGQCERILDYGICTFVTNEMDAFFGTDYINKALDKLFGGGSASNLNERSGAGPVQEALVAESLSGSVKEGVDNAKDFAKEDLAVLARSGAGGIGYSTELPLFKTICSLAIYHRLPGIDTFANFNLDRPFIGTSVSVNWNSKVDHVTPLGQPIFEYQIDWMVLAGMDNMRYEVYLKNPQGGRSQLLNKRAFLDRSGDHDSGYLQFLGEIDYTEACVNIPSEPPERCFPPGTRRRDIEERLTGYDKKDFADKDEDGMADDWETANNLDPSNPNDATQDSDYDGRTNVREFREGSDPNKTDVGTVYSSEIADSECKAVFTKDITFKNSNRDVAVYKYGDRIEVLNDNLINVERPESDVEVKVEILGKTSGTRENRRFNAHVLQSNANFIVWEIPNDDNAPPTDMYNAKFSLVKSGKVRDLLCSDASNRITNSVKEKEIVIYDPKFSGCNDFGGRDLGERQACISGSGGNVNVETERCENERLLVEYSCQNQQCVAENVFCPENSICQNGKCVLRKDVVTTPAPVVPATPTRPTETSVFDGLARESAINLLGQIPGDDWNDIGQIENRARRTFENLQGINVVDYINAKSNEHGIDPLLTLAVITVESNGDQKASSNVGATGLMQVYPSAHPKYDINKLKNDAFYNIDAGIEILKGYYNTYYTNDSEYFERLGICENEAETNKRFDYTKWQRALRAYNGFGCVPPNADNYYVEKVMVAYFVWRGLYPSLVS